MLSAAFYLWAGALHVWTLLTIAAYFYFPVYLDSKASHGSESAGLSLPGPALAAVTAIAVALAQSERAAAWMDRAVRPPLVTPVRMTVFNLLLWSAFTTWRSTGIVLWDAGPAWAAPLYFVYWIASGTAAYSLSLRGGLARFTGCAQILEACTGGSGSKQELYTGSLYGFTRHPVASFLVPALWTTPLLTLDRLAWATIWTIGILFGVELEERRLERAYGEAHRLYRGRVPKWIPFFPRRDQGGRHDSQ